MMKKFFFLFMVVIAMAACSDDGGVGDGGGQQTTASLNIDTENINISANGGQSQVVITSTAAWTIEIEDDWCSVEPANGNAGSTKVTITTAENETYDDRTTTLVVKSSSLSKSISVAQKQSNAIISSDKEFSVSADGETIAIEVKSNIDVEIEIPEDVDWIKENTTRGLEANTYYFDVAENNTDQRRTANIWFANAENDVTNKVTVIQYALGTKILYTSTDGGIVTPYNADAFGATIVSNTYEEGVGVITFDGSVTSIGEDAFNYCGTLESITIPDGTTSIGDYAFHLCEHLESVTIPDSVTSIGDAAFERCYYLASITIPDSVTTIGGGVFKYCENLSAFYGKYASADNRCLIVDGELKSFAPFGLTSYTIPDSVTSIGDYTFSCCVDLENVTIPSSVTSIGDAAFERCYVLKSITIPNGVTSIGKQVFFYCHALESVAIPDSVTSIGEGVFVLCTQLSAFYGKYASEDNRCLIVDGEMISFAPFGLTSYTIPDSVTSIGDCAFMSCDYLERVIIGNNVKSIGKEAFYNCYALESITIPDSVTSIGEGAFWLCEALESVYSKPVTPPTLDKGVFDDTPSLQHMYVPAGSVDAYKSAQGWSEYASIIFAEP